MICSLTWPDILALDAAALNAAIDTHVYGYTWHPSVRGDSEPGDYWLCTDEPGTLGTFSSVPYFHHHAGWDRTMALRWSQRISLSVTDTPGTWILWVEGLEDAPPLYATTEAEARVAICRLSLWRRIREQGNGKPTKRYTLTPAMLRAVQAKEDTPHG